ncbi:MAG: methyltransferase [Pseudomonadota bacterium]
MAFTGPSEQPLFSGWLARQVARPAFQDWASRMPVLNRLARRDGAEIFQLVQGFVQSQVLYALVKLNLPRRLMDGPLLPEALALSDGFDTRRMALLLQAGAGIGLLKRHRDGRFGLTRKGAALCGVPGLEQMILHHDVLYRDMADPVALLRGKTETELADFWPYVFGANGAVDAGVTETYSDLMANSQALVARDTLRTVSLDGVRRLVDVGGGSGAFLIEVAKAYPALELELFDLPAVMSSARERVSRAGLSDRIELIGGSFKEDALPEEADAISLIRVLYDHDESAIRNLIAKVFAALPPSGRLIISEPMSGGARPDPITDVYFAFYTLAMRTGQARSADAIAKVCADAGFVDIQTPKPFRSYVTSVVVARKPGG